MPKLPAVIVQSEQELIWCAGGTTFLCNPGRESFIFLPHLPSSELLPGLGQGYEGAGVVVARGGVGGGRRSSPLARLGFDVVL